MRYGEDAQDTTYHHHKLFLYDAVQSGSHDQVWLQNTCNVASPNIDLLSSEFRRLYMKKKFNTSLIIFHAVYVL